MNAATSGDQHTLGILHPGDMGASIAASAQNSGCKVYWTSEGRSADTAERANKIGLTDAGSLAGLCASCEVIVSVCPPDAAETIADSVLQQGFTGLYIDANAISPQRAKHIGQMMAVRGARFVDGGIIGGPAWKPNSTWLYLSGEDALSAAECFSAGPLETRILGKEIGKASALKMCFAAYTKGTTALLSAVMAAAEALDVREALEQQWSQDGSAFAQEAAQRVRTVTAKAWRFTGEMDEIAATLGSVGLPDGFHTAAGEVYRRLADFKGVSTPTLEAVLATLLLTEHTAK